MTPEEQNPLTPREAHLVTALLASLSISIGIGMAVYAVAASRYGKDPTDMLLGAAAVTAFSLIVSKTCQRRRP